jgi:PAS domain S-box-containing protein
MTNTAEESRLAAVHALELVDTPPEERFDRITRLVQVCLNAPIVLMTLVDRDRLFFKSRQGTALTELLRKGSFCDRVLQRDEDFVVEDAAGDPRFRHHGLVSGPAGVRFYAGYPVCTHDGHVVGTLCILDTRPRSFDAAERSRLASFARLVEAELHREHLERTRARAGSSEGELRRFFSLSLDMLCVAGHDGYFKELNPAWESTLGWTRAELLERPYVEFVHREDRGRTVQEARLLERGDITVAFENRYRCKDGSYRNLLWSAVADPVSQRVFAVARDITALRATEEALRRARAIGDAANRGRGRFLASLARELRAPLNAVLGFADTLLAGSSGMDERQQSFAERIQAGGRELSQCVQSLHELAQIESGEAQTSREPVDVVGLAAAVVASLEPEARAKGLALGLDSPESLEPVASDPRRLRQALERVAGQALRETERGEVRVRVLADAGAGRPERIEVVEGTPGEAGEWRGVSGLMPRLERGDATAREPAGGLSIAIARALCERLGHRLQVVSRTGAGTTYTIHLA